VSGFRIFIDEEIYPTNRLRYYSTRMAICPHLSLSIQGFLALLAIVARASLNLQAVVELLLQMGGGKMKYENNLGRPIT